MLIILLAVSLAEPALAQRRGGRRTRAERKQRHGERKAAPPPAQAPAEEPARPQRAAAGREEERELKRGERVEFDGRLIEGQTAASGAIYLFERLPSELRSMVGERRSYRREVLETLYPNGIVPSEQRGERAAGR